MKKQFLVASIVVFLVVLSVYLKPSFASQEEQIELRFSTFLPLQHYGHVKVLAPFAKQLEERTKGRVKVTFYPMQTLGKAKDHYDMAVRGIADICTFLQIYTPGRFPLTEVMNLPLGISSAETASRIFWELSEKYMKKEYADVKILQLATVDPAHIQTTKKPVKTLADLEGCKIRVGGPEQTEIIRAWGASPINLAVPDIYDAMHKGMIDGTLIGFSSLIDYRLIELVNYTTIVNGVSPTVGWVMNLQKWNSLPPDIQKIIDELTGLKVSVYQGKIFDEAAQLGMEEAKKKGGQIYKLPPAEMKIWMDKLKPVCDAWVADKEAKGLPGKAIYQDAVSLVEKYSKE